MDKEPWLWYNRYCRTKALFSLERREKWAKKDGIARTAFYETERANVKMDGTHDHQLLWVKVGDCKKLAIGKPKSRSSMRKIPMTEDVAESFMRIVQNREECATDVNVDGVGGFLFLRKDGQPVRTCDWYQYFKSMQKRYNASYGEQMKITPHVCRHTFCSKMAVLYYFLWE